MPTHTHSTLIVGAGFTGLGTAIKLAQAGVDDIVILERSDRVGGTWRDNTYPGAACDVPSLLYSFSFVKNPTWSRAYSPAGEIRQHIEDMADRFDVRRFIRFGVEVTGLSFDENDGVWTVTTNSRKRFRARTVVLASGPLPDHRFPDIRGLDSYRGHKIHSANWDHDYDFTGKRVAVIGTGASAVQIVPELVKTAAARQGVPAHARLGAAAPRRPDSPAGAGFVRAPARHPAARPPGLVLGT